MFKTVFLALLALIAFPALCITILLVYQGKRKPQGTPQYVALGSSYAAGLGLGPRAAGSPLICMRSTNGYPQQLARLRGLSLVDMTCSGATATHVLHGGQVFLGPQVDALNADTQLVTLTAGGNDISYVGDLSFMAGRTSHSLLGWALRHFWKGPLSLEQRDYATLKSNFVATLQEIRRRAPQSRIVVVTYPMILPPEGTCSKLQITEEQVVAMRQVGERLAAVTRAAAAEGGAILVDMQVLGAEHHACSGTPWVNGWADAAGTAFHPTLEGSQATARAIADALDRPH